MLLIQPDILIAARQHDLAAEAAHQRLLRQVPRQPSALGRHLAAVFSRVSQLDRRFRAVPLRTDSDLKPV
jgi:hypothetical protein